MKINIAEVRLRGELIISKLENNVIFKYETIPEAFPKDYNTFPNSCLRGKNEREEFPLLLYLISYSKSKRMKCSFKVESSFHIHSHVFKIKLIIETGKKELLQKAGKMWLLTFFLYIEYLSFSIEILLPFWRRFSATETKWEIWICIKIMKIVFSFNWRTNLRNHFVSFSGKLWVKREMSTFLLKKTLIFQEEKVKFT